MEYYKIDKINTGDDDIIVVIGRRGVGKKICILEWIIKLHVFDKDINKELQEIIEILKGK